jgi:hypothetical protein
MLFMLCRNRVKDFATWKKVFDSHAQAHRDAGLHLTSLWRSRDEPNNVFFLFAVSDADGAQAFVNAPEGKESAEASGVVDGEFHFLESGGGYDDP